MCTTEKEKIEDISTSESFALSDFFHNPRVVGLFTVLVGTATVISLLPLFLGFLLNSTDWLSQLLATTLGYFTFCLILIAVYLGVIFMLFISGNIFSEFYVQVLKKPYSRGDKIFSLIAIACFLISFLALSIALINVWAIKAILSFNYITSLTIIYFGMLLGTIIFSIGIVILLNINHNKKRIDPLERIKKIKCLRLILTIVLLALICLLGYFLFTWLSGPTSLIVNYYNDTNKSITINLTYNESSEKNAPTILYLHQTATNVSNIGVDLYNLECRWSTNYGYFVEVNDNNSEIITHQQEVVFPGYPQCPLLEDNVQWTYDDSKYGKNKPNVLIGFTMKDRNKGKILGGNYLNLTWNQTDYLIQSSN